MTLGISNPAGAPVRVPFWLNGNDIPGLAIEAQLKLHPVDASTGQWRIEALENEKIRKHHVQ